MIPLVDSHFHIWRRDDLPWLAGPMQPRIFGPYEPIRRDYPITEYLADTRDHGVEKAVYVQANWAKERFLDEARFVSEAARRTGWPHGLVAYVDMLKPDIRPDLDELSRFPLLRGIRMQLHWHANEQYRFAARPDLARDTTLQRNVGYLAERNLAFDLQVFSGQMTDAAMLAEACPSVTFVLQHAGMPEDLSDAGRAEWRAGMVRLAAQGNVVSKLSGLGTFIHRNDPAHIAEIVRETVGIFGAGRCLFGSNFPIEKLWTGYGELAAAYRAAIAPLPAADRQAIASGTATRVYRL
jgi:predicted TIM-barrel fold metal-dependent hydrolase